MEAQDSAAAPASLSPISSNQQPIMPPPGGWRPPRKITLRDFLGKYLPHCFVVLMLAVGYSLYRNMLNIFAVRVGAKWVTLLEGSAGTVSLFVLQVFVLKKPISKTWYAVILFGFLLFACFQAWEEEYKRGLRPDRDLQTLAEPQDSLRRRAKQLVEDVELFWKDRQGHHPPYTNGNPAATGVQAKTNQASVRYDEETESQCLVKFLDRTRGIVEELKAKGVDVSSGYFDALVQQRRCLDQSQLTQFLDLAYHVDATDRLVIF
jgi:hypothetical protein